MVFSAEKIRSDFPVLSRKFNGHSLTYLDSGATSQMPFAVIDAVSDYYKGFKANPHRGLYALSHESTQKFENARAAVAKFIGARSPDEVIFVRNATEAINLVANAWGRANLKPTDHVLSTVQEHHANIVSWQVLKSTHPFVLDYAEVDSQGRFFAKQFEKLAKNTKLVAFSAQSNVTGFKSDVKAIAKTAHAQGALALVDACQAIPHQPVNVRDWNADFVAFSGHKMLGPFGIGVLYAKRELLEEMPPFMGGGEMIKEVKLSGTTFDAPPHKFEAGTPDVGGAVGLHAAIDYLGKLGLPAVSTHEAELTTYALKLASERAWMRVVGPSNVKEKGGVLAFDTPGMHSHDLGSVLDELGIAVRAGFHCAEPLHHALGLKAGSTRASWYVYSTKADLDKLFEGLDTAHKLFGK